MRKGIIKTAFAALALSMMVGAPLATLNVSANDGLGIYAEKDNTYIKDLDREAVVTASSANVREGINTETRVLNVFDKGTKFHIDGVACKDSGQTNWYRVIVKDQKYGGETAGYIHKSTFEFTDNKDSKKEDKKEQKDTKCEYKVEKVTKNMTAADDVYVRKGPKTTYSKMGSYTKGDTVKVTGQVYKHGNKACWVQVSYKGETGYVCSDYLK